jgi:hypothetical protein
MAKFRYVIGKSLKNGHLTSCMSSMRPLLLFVFLSTDLCPKAGSPTTEHSKRLVRPPAGNNRQGRCPGIRWRSAKMSLVTTFPIVRDSLQFGNGLTFFSDLS